MLRFVALVDRLSDWSLLASAALVSYIMVTQALEVVLRSIGRPTIWVYDLNLAAVVGVVFLGIAGAEKAREHIAVDFITARLSERTNRILYAANAAFALLLLGLVSWFGISIVAESIRQGRTMGGLFPIPTAIPEAALPFGAILLALQTVADLYRKLWLREAELPPKSPIKTIV